MSGDRRLLDELGRPVSAPDQTDAIMGRLGFERTTPADLRRHRRLRGLSRVALVFLGGAMIGIAMEATVRSGATRTPEGPTIPEALHRDMQNQSNRLERTIQMFRDIAPASHGRPAPPPPRVDEEIDRSAIADVKWI